MKRAALVLGMVWQVLIVSSSVNAQSLGTFRWQIQPYCNVLSLTVEQKGVIYELQGTDDQCGGPQPASVQGIAMRNALGTITLGLTTVTAPGAMPVHIAATLSLPTLGGTWRDSEGQSGDFAFRTGGGTGGNPRPTLAGPAPTIAPRVLDAHGNFVGWVDGASATRVINGRAFEFRVDQTGFVPTEPTLWFAQLNCQGPAYILLSSSDTGLPVESRPLVTVMYILNGVGTIVTDALEHVQALSMRNPGQACAAGPGVVRNIWGGQVETLDLSSLRLTPPFRIR
jgi:hypothetical protein